MKLLGDGALIETPSAAEALETAVAIQTQMRAPDHPYVSPERIRLRASLHVGM